MIDESHWLWPWVMKAARRLASATEVCQQLSRTILTSYEVGKALAVLSGTVPGVRWTFLDVSYQSCSPGDMELVIANDWSGATFPEDEFNDCDDYAWTFKQHCASLYRITAVGFVLDNLALHAYNVIVTADGVARLYEPQENRYIKIGEYNERLDVTYSFEGAQIFI